MIPSLCRPHGPTHLPISIVWSPNRDLPYQQHGIYILLVWQWFSTPLLPLGHNCSIYPIPHPYWCEVGLLISYCSINPLPYWGLSISHCSLNHFPAEAYQYHIAVSCHGASVNGCYRNTRYWLILPSISHCMSNFEEDAKFGWYFIKAEIEVSKWTFGGQYYELTFKVAPFIRM